MYFNSFEEFIAMGGHGFYVWLCYATVISSLVFYYWYSSKLAEKHLAKLNQFYRQLDSHTQANKTAHTDKQTEGSDSSSDAKTLGN